MTRFDKTPTPDAISKPMTDLVQYEDFELANGQYVLAAEEDQPAGTLHVWTQGGEQWACRAYDHGPFCRRGTRLDATGAACIAMVIEGRLLIYDKPDGLTFKISQAGKRRVETAIRRGGFARGLDG